MEEESGVYGSTSDLSSHGLCFGQLRWYIYVFRRRGRETQEVSWSNRNRKGKFIYNRKRGPSANR